MRSRLPSRAFRALAISLLLVGAAAATLGFASPQADERCSHAQGRLFNAVEPGTPGRMIGTISGDYWPDSENPWASYDPDDTAVLFLWGPTRVEGNRGTIYFMEYGAVDLDEQRGPNGGVLVTVTGGTGKWEGASGHLALSGYFHTDEGTGQWDYQGEVCTP